MRRLLLFSSIFVIALCSCPSGFDLVSDGQCRGEYATMTIHTADATNGAISKCNEVHGQPISIHDQEEQSYWTDKASKTNTYVMLGLKCNTNTKQWVWADGSSVDFRPPKYSNLDNDCNNDCAWYLYTGDGKWNRVCTSDSTNDFTYIIYCTTQLQQPTVCDEFEDDSQDGSCYQVHSNALNWQDAKTTCRNLGANVASIHNLQENAFIRRLAVSNGAVNGIYLGATRSGEGKNFGWIDGSSWDYDNFYPDNPVYGEGDCLAMDTFSASGEWMNIDCSSKLAVACARKEDVSPTCTSGPWTEGQAIYSPGYPYDASVPCDYFLTVAAGKKVQVEVMVLEANTCCDRLVLEDAKLGGNVVANLTGEISDRTYTTASSSYMRVSWQPNGGVNVRGVMFTYHGV